METRGGRKSRGGFARERKLLTLLGVRRTWMAGGGIRALSRWQSRASETARIQCKQMVFPERTSIEPLRHSLRIPHVLALNHLYGLPTSVPRRARIQQAERLSSSVTPDEVHKRSLKLIRTLLGSKRENMYWMILITLSGMPTKNSIPT